MLKNKKLLISFLFSFGFCSFALLFYIWLTRPGVIFEGLSKAGKSLGISSENYPEPTPVSEEFALLIPKLNINAPVIPNVDGTRQSEYHFKALEGIAHFKHIQLPDYTVDGSFPGEGGNIFLFGHSQIPGGDTSSYQAIFDNLEKLIKGDEAIVYYKGNRFRYIVFEGKVVPKTATEYLERTPQETLTLMTCWPLGLDVKRYIVRARKVES